MRHLVTFLGFFFVAPVLTKLFDVRYDYAHSPATGYDPYSAHSRRHAKGIEVSVRCTPLWQWSTTLLKPT